MTVKKPTWGHRFWTKVDKHGPISEARPELGPCWIWTAHRLPKGYGRFRIDGKYHMAHRVAFELLVGPIPPEHMVHHRCETTACVRPDHLEALSPADHAAAHPTSPINNAGKTRCVRGHELAGDNVYVREDNGARQCRRCERIRRSRS